MKPARKSVGVAERQNSLQALGVMATNLPPISPDALLKIVEQVKEYYVELSPNRQRGRPRTFSGRAFLLLAVVGVVLRTFKPQELAPLLTKDLPLRQALGFERVPHRRTLERRLDATLPAAEAQVQALGQQILEEVEPGPDDPQASAIEGRMYQAQGPRWHKRDREQGQVPAGLRNVDRESAWSKSGYRGWVQGYRLVLPGLVFPAPVPLFARWCSNAVGESTVLAPALAAEQVPVTELLLGASTFGGADLVATYALPGGWLLTPSRCPRTRSRGNMTCMPIAVRPSSCSSSASSKPVTSKPAPPKAWRARAPLSSLVCGSIKCSFWTTIGIIDLSLTSRRSSMKDGGALLPELRADFRYLGGVSVSVRAPNPCTVPARSQMGKRSRPRSTGSQ